MKNDFFKLEINSGVATIWIDSTKDKVNIVYPSLINDFEEVFENINENNNIKGAVLISAKEDFIAGADIKSFIGEKVGDFQPISRKGHQLLEKIENSKKPIISAIHGTCYGLGTEISLSCKARICSNDPKTKIALPEVKLGLLPGAGGTQRLPKLVGLTKSLDIMLTGKNIYAYPAKKIGLVDEVVDKSKLHRAAKKMIDDINDKKFKRRRIKKSLINKFLDHTSLGRNIVFNQAQKKITKLTKGNYPAPIEIIKCVKTGFKNGRKAGFEAEVILFEKLILSDVSRSLRNLFFISTEKKKNPYLEKPKNIERIAVLGAGFMGGGITDVSVNNGIDVVLKDLNEKMLISARLNIWKNLKKKINKKQIHLSNAKNIAQKAIGQTNYNGFSSVDVVIEAVVENMEVKKKIINELEDICHEDFIFASNTSSLPLTEMANAAKKPENIVGMHYFSPVTKMPLLEIIRTKQTSNQTLATCYEIGRKQGKTCIVVNDMPGFYVNRILCPYLVESLLMIEEGVRIEAIDKALTNLGMPIGPIALLDEVGIDIGVHVMSGNMADFVKDREGFKINNSLPKMLDAGLLGRKSRKGFYTYRNKRGKLKKEKTNDMVYKYFDNPKTKILKNEEITDRVILLLLNEAVWCLEDEIIENAKDGDIGGVFGIGFLPWSGGPFSYMNRIGISNVVEKLNYYSSIYGPKYKPRPLLLKMNEKGVNFDTKC